MAVNKHYKQGAGDVGKVAEKALNAVADEIKGGVDNLRKGAEGQRVINNQIFDEIDNISDELKILKYGKSFVDFTLPETLHPSVRSIINGVIYTISESSEKCRNVALIINKKFPALRFSNINGNLIRRMDYEIQKLCIFYIYALLKFSDDDETVKHRAEPFFRYFELSIQTQEEIKQYVFSMNEKDILNLIQDTRQGKSNVIAIGRNALETSAVVNYLFSMKKVPEGFNQNDDEIETITTLESSITVNGIFKISNDDEKNNSLADKIDSHISKQINGDIITSIVYCVNVEQGRFFDYEQKFLERILCNAKINIIFALTSCTSKAKAKTLENNIAKRMNRFNCLFVNLLTERILIADKTLEPFGDKMLSDIICNGGN